MGVHHIHPVHLLCSTVIGNVWQSVINLRTCRLLTVLSHTGVFMQDQSDYKHITLKVMVIRDLVDCLLNIVVFRIFLETLYFHQNGLALFP